MLKLLFWVILLAVVAFMFGFKRGRPAPREERRAAPVPPVPSPAPLPESIVSCAECGLHLPASESLPGRGGQFCTAAHRAAHEARLAAAEAAEAAEAADAARGASRR